MRRKVSQRSNSDTTFETVVDAFARNRQVTRETRQGFGSGTLKVKGKIFAMISSTGQFVVKLPKVRVDELVSLGMGARFDPGHGRLMKEWVTVPVGIASWIDLAREACQFVSRQK